MIPFRYSKSFVVNSAINSSQLSENSREKKTFHAKLKLLLIQIPRIVISVLRARAAQSVAGWSRNVLRYMHQAEQSCSETSDVEKASCTTRSGATAAKRLQKKARTL